MNSISFTASLKSDNATIKSRKGNNFIPQKAFIAELDKNDPQDLESLHKLCLLWNKESSNLVPNLFSDFIQDIDFKPDVNADHCFVLTLQDENYENIDPRKVLGISLFSEEDVENEINWLQVQPKNNSLFKPESREYENGGTALFNFLKERYPGKPIYINSANDAVEFYKKQGCKVYDENFPCSLHYEA